jgi:Tc toxin complex TcA C-terminal TcB-binding domain
VSSSPGFHELRTVQEHLTAVTASLGDPTFIYTFENFFHPFVGSLIERLNQASLAGLLDPVYQETLTTKFFGTFYSAATASGDQLVSLPAEIDVSNGGPYANYNWELLFHVPLAIAVQLSNNQRFAEAQRWFHYIFDPTSNDTSKEPPLRYWRFLRFRQDTDVQNINDLLRLLSRPDSEITDPKDKLDKQAVLNGYAAIQNNPFQPHLVAATRTIAYQYHVVMKYLDNLIAWGDSLFREDTAESLNEATQRYVLASNILGPRPQQVPTTGTKRGMTFAQLKTQQLDAMGNALVELESQFPFNTMPAPHAGPGSPAGAPLPGLGRTLYFCVPRNQQLLAYWDRVADRLFKIRNCMNIDGVTRQLALFEPAIDPGLLVKAVAAGIDAGVAATGQLQPVGPLRCGFLIQQALGLCHEVGALGTALLSAIEKGDAEALAVLRQGHEVRVRQLAQDARFLQWRQAQAATDALLRGREVTLERYRYQRRLLGLDTDVPDWFVIQRPTNPGDPPLLDEAGFDRAYLTLVGLYDLGVSLEGYPQLRLAGDQSPANTAGASGTGRLNLNTHEDQELNKNLPAARDLRTTSSVLDTVASVVTLIPDLDIDLHFWGLGLHSKVFGGEKLAAVSRIAADIIRTLATREQDQAGMAARTASYERRADEWTLQHNLAARELMQVGRQILAAILTEQAAYREYLNQRDQVGQAQEADSFLRGKYTNRELYTWMQGELTRVYYDYYHFAIDVARKAEQTMKRELMSADLDQTQFVQTSYWDAGRQGLLAAEALALDLRRMEMAYHENRRREYELIRHVSLMQLDPLALLELRATGSCEVSVPESLFDLGSPGHYMRRIKQVSLSIPGITGPYTSVSCTLSLRRSSVRTTPTGSGYRRAGGRDDRFTDYAGTIQSIVTSSGRDDSGMFEPSARDERFLPFEGAGAISSWRLDLPAEFRQFDYDTIPDVILHLRYTAREGGGVLRDAAVANLKQLVADAQAAGSARLLSMRQEFPSAWARMKATPAGQRAELAVELREEHYPYWSQGLARQIRGVEVLARAEPGTASLKLSDGPDPAAHSDTLSRDDVLGGLLRGNLASIPLPASTGPFSLYLDDPAVDDLWLILTWGGP